MLNHKPGQVLSMTQKTLRRHLADDRRIIDRELNRWLQPVPGVPRLLSQAMCYATLGSGKRLRPILALESFRATGGSDERWVLPFCCGIEMIHAFSLAHDDLPAMDNDDYRRGRLSLHRRFGEGSAILAADALLVRAFELFAASPAPVERRIIAIIEISQAVGWKGMTAGQILDLDATRDTDSSCSARRLSRIHRLKTAMFIAACFTTGAMLAGADATLTNALRRAGLMIGDLFQLTDDLLDAKRPDVGRNVALQFGQKAVWNKAVRRAASARRMLRELGPRFSLLALVPEYVLHRSF